MQPGEDNPDVEIPGAEVGPFNVVVATENIAPASDVLIEVKPEFGEVLSATAQVTGTTASGTAQASFAIPPGNGYITARTTVPLTKGSDLKADGQFSYLDTGLAPTGEPFDRVELAAGIGGQQQSAFIIASGKRYSIPAE